MAKFKSKSHKSPRGLSACVRKVYAALDEDDQYRADERVNSDRSKTTIDKIVNHVIAGNDYSNKEEIIYATKKYREYLVRQEKPMLEEQKVLLAKSNRITQRKKRLYERRMKVAVCHQIAVMKNLVKSLCPTKRLMMRTLIKSCQ